MPTEKEKAQEVVDRFVATRVIDPKRIEEVNEQIKKRQEEARAKGGSPQKSE
jgi:hypothetical protein